MDPAPERPGGEVPEAAVSGSRTPDHESIVNPERAKVIGALDETLLLMEEARSIDGLSEEQQHKLNDVKYAKSRTLDVGKTYFSHESVVSETTGKKYRYQERIPTDGMLDFLHAKVLTESAKPPSRQNAELLKKYRTLEQTLMENSRSVRASQRDPDRLVERVRLEAQLISRSDRDTGDPVQNWYLAEKAISSRLHLIIPRETKPTELSTFSEPDEDEFIGPVMPERLPAPGDPDFIGPVLPPSPSEEGFIGPVLPDKPDLIGPVLPDEAASTPSTEEDLLDDVGPTDTTIDDLLNRRILIQFGSLTADVKKHIENTVRKEVTDREAIVDKDGRPMELGDKSIARAWNVIKYRLSPRGMKQGVNGLMRDKFRYMRSTEYMDAISKLNRGETHELNDELASSAKRHLDSIRSDADHILNRTRTYIENEQSAPGEEISDIIEGPFRTFVTDTLLYGDEGILNKLRSGSNDEQLQIEIQRSLNEYVQSHQDDETIQKFFGKNETRYGDISEFYATDLIGTAKEINRQAEVHSIAVDMLKDQIDIRLIRAQQEKATEIDYTTFERLMVLSQKNRVASWVLSPTRAGLIAAVATVGAHGAVRKSAMIGAGAILSPWAAPVVGIAVAASFAYGRERQRFKSDTLDTARDHEQGSVAPREAKYRKSIEAVISPLRVKADQLINGDREEDTPDRITQEKRKSIEYLKEAQISYSADVDLDQRRETTMNLHSMLSRIAEIESRLSAPTSIETKSIFSEVGRIQYDPSSGKSLEAQRTDLALALVELRNRITDLSEDQRDSAQETLERYRSEWKNYLIEDKQAQEHEFKRARLKRALGQGAKMGVIGGVAGFIGQEALATAARYVPGADSLPGFNKGQTQAEKLLGINKDAGKTETIRSVTVEGTKDIVVDSPDAATMPDIEKVQSIIETGHGNFKDYQISYDHNKGMSVIDTRTNTPVFDFKDVKINPETGKISITGEIPNEAKGVFREMQFNVDAVDPVNSPIEHTVFGPDVPTYEAAMGTGQGAPLTQIPEGTVWIDGKDGAHTLIVADRPDIVLIPDAKIVDGEITWDKDYTYPEYDARIGERTNGLFSQMKISYEDGALTISTESTPILGENGIWKELSTNIDSREWYSYDQPGSQGNELELFTIKQGGKVFLDMGAMELGYQSGLDPNPIDVPQTIQNREAGFYFSLPNLSKEGIFIPLDADGSWEDRGLWLDPTDTDPNNVITLSDGRTIQYGSFSRMVLDEEALSRLPDGNIATELYDNREVFSLGQNGENGFIEAGRIVQQDNQTVFQAFATIQGEAPIGDTVEVSAHGSVPTINFGAPLTEKLPITEITVPPTPPQEVISVPTPKTFDTTVTELEEPPPIIPIGFAPRETLERTIPLVNPEPSGGYNSPITQEQRAILQPRLSNRLRNNPNAILDFHEEATDYFARQRPEYTDEIRRLSMQITSPPSNNLRAMVCIPVAGHQESGNIYRTLENYTTQDTPLDQFEIILFVNRPDKDKSGNTTSSDETLAEVERFRSNYPDFPVRVVNKVFEGGTTIGNIRKYGTDLAIMRQLESNPTGGDIAIISNDADNMGVSPTYLSSYLKKFDENPEADGLMGELDWDPEAYAKYPLVLLGTRLFQYIDIQKRHESQAKGDNESRHIASSGACFAIRASTYTAVGGYLEDASVGEDNLLGKAIRVGRQTTEDGMRIQHAGGGTRIYTSARRAILAVTNGLAPSHQWYNYGNDEMDEEVRKFELGDESEINYDDPLIIDRLQKDLERIIQQTFFMDYGLSPTNSSGGSTSDERIMSRSLSLLGIKADIQGKKVQVNNMDEIVHNLKLYKEIAVIQRDIKSGKGTDEMYKRYVEIVQHIQEEKQKFKANRQE